MREITAPNTLNELNETNTLHTLRDRIVAMRDAEVGYLVAECGNMITSDMFLVKGLIHGYDEVIALIDVMAKNGHEVSEI